MPTTIWIIRMTVIATKRGQDRNTPIIDVVVVVVLGDGFAGMTRRGWLECVRARACDASAN
jgi:hypothetical protein